MAPPWIERKKGWVGNGGRVTGDGVRGSGEGEEVEAEPARAVSFNAMICPACGESSAETGKGRGIKTYATRRPLRYHKCLRCGWTFKSSE